MKRNSAVVLLVVLLVSVSLACGGTGGGGTPTPTPAPAEWETVAEVPPSTATEMADAAALAEIPFYIDDAEEGMVTFLVENGGVEEFAEVYCKLNPETAEGQAFCATR